MFYHCRDLKYVVYGRVYPPPIEIIDSKTDISDKFFTNAYQWVGHYCGFFPQIWLSRSRSSITGFKSRRFYTKFRRTMGGKTRKETKFEKPNEVLFGFDDIQGFPIDFGFWEMILGEVAASPNLEEQNNGISKMFNEFLQWHYEDAKEDSTAKMDRELRAWVDCGGDLDTFLQKKIFVLNDQVVVPSLNLKCAKKIICRNERQKKELRNMGFLEDRIQIKNMTRKKF